jgi:N-acetylneuraminate synthase
MSVSTGASTQEEIWATLNTIIKSYTVPRLIVFHCKSSYPADPLEMNLRAGTNISYRVDNIGLSDHTRSSEAACLALASGYTYFEKHFCGIDDPHDNPDSVVALYPSEFKGYVSSLRRAEKILGSNIKRVSKSEEKERVWARRGKNGLRPTEEYDADTS